MVRGLVSGMVAHEEDFFAHSEEQQAVAEIRMMRSILSSLKFIANPGDGEDHLRFFGSLLQFLA